MLTSSPEGIPVLEPKALVRRRFVMTLGVAAVFGLIALLMAGSGANDKVLGGGSTVAQPLIERVAVAFQNARSGDGDWVAGSSGIEYEPIGSLGGVMRLDDPEFDFAITDYPLSTEALLPRDAVQFPIFVGSIAVVYRLGQVEPPLQFSPATLAGIFAGRITTWSDPAIAAENPGIALPATAISVVHRSDGSGSTLNWSGYVASGDAGWRDDVGSGTTLDWPAGTGVKGGGEMAKAVAATDGAIGYLETGQARRAGLSVARLRNAAGRFVEPAEANVVAAAQGIGLAGVRERAANPGGAVDASAADAYPIVAASYVVMKKSNASSGDNRRALRFFAFLFDQGPVLRESGYLMLSSQAIGSVRRIWSHEFGFDAPDHAVASNP